MNNSLFAFTNEPVNQNKIKAYLGSIVEKTDDGMYEKPSKNLQANDLEVGTEVYAIDFPMKNHLNELITVKKGDSYYLCRPYG